MDITINTAAKVQLNLNNVEVTMSTKDLFIQLCRSLNLNPDVILQEDRGTRYILKENGLHIEDDISHHGSPCWEERTFFELSETDIKRYEALKALFKLI